MMRLSVLVVMLVLWGGCVAARDPFVAVGDPVQATAAWYTDRIGDPSCVVAVSDGRSVGDMHAVYRIASITKLFMTQAAEDMAAEGRIDLDLPVRTHAPFALAEEYEGVTVRDLLYHRTGLPREPMTLWNPMDGWRGLSCGLLDTHLYGWFDCAEGFARALNGRMCRRGVREKTGGYSNVGFGLGFLVLEKAYGLDLEAVLRPMLARRGLGETGFRNALREGLAVQPLTAGDVPWLARRGSAVAEHPLSVPLQAAGGLYSSAADCLRIAESQWGLIDRDSRGKTAWREGETVAGLCVHCLENGDVILYRSGMLYGGSSFVGFDLKTRKSAVILRNVTSWPDSVGLGLMAQLNAGK